MPKKERSKEDSVIQPGLVAKVGSQTLRSYSVGALPIINRLLERLDLEAKLQVHLKRSGPRSRLPVTTGLLLLVRNFLVSREPIYGMGEWAARYAPDLLGLKADQLALLNDDRVGRNLACLFDSDQPELVLDVIRHVREEFGLRFDELHNDSTTVSFYGAYDNSTDKDARTGRPLPVITYGHSKDHRPDLKQLLYTLTVTEDGGVPIYFTTHSGNTVDDRTHCDTWDVLKELVGKPNFLYVADCKLASTENMDYIHRQNGRFITVLPRSRKEDAEFRERLLKSPDKVLWEPLYEVKDDWQRVVDRLSYCAGEIVTADRYRLWWFHSTRKAQMDHRRRMKAIQRATVELDKLRDRLLGPRPRLRRRDQVAPLVADILRESGAEELLRVDINEYEGATYRQLSPGRPGKNTKYQKLVETMCDITWESDPEALVEQQKMDGVFPLITNATDMTAEEVLRAYKRQPFVEKRFSQFKSDYHVAPVYLKTPSRIQAMLCVYFFALLVQTLLERELRHAMKHAGIKSLPLYPEDRACKAPSARRIFDVFEPIQRHTLGEEDDAVTFGSELTPLQRQILEILNIPADDYAR